MTNREWLLERLSWENWERLLPYTVRYAREQMRQRRRGGNVMLPGGHDANDVASKVVARVLAGEGRLALGWTRQRLEAELKRQVNRELRRLASRKESSTTISEWEVLPPDERGQAQSVFDEMAGRITNAGDGATRRGKEQLEKMGSDLEKQLDGDVVAQGVLRCLAEGVWKRREIAARLSVDVEAITAARKRLGRKLVKVEGPRIARMLEEEPREPVSGQSAGANTSAAAAIGAALTVHAHSRAQRG